MLELLGIVGEVVAEIDLVVWFLTTRSGRWTLAIVVVLLAGLVAWTGAA